MSDTTNYKYWGNSNAICPYCDFEEQDSWEWVRDNVDETDVECGKCGKEFHLVIQHETTYSTSKLEDAS